MAMGRNMESRAMRRARGARAMGRGMPPVRGARGARGMTSMRGARPTVMSAGRPRRPMGNRARMMRSQGRTM
tara:strand:+ start:13544 stop:13759 length:216 start_codon:yes stop_codon:yes gene_type:complete